MEGVHITKFLAGKNKKVFIQLKNFEIIKEVFILKLPFVDIKALSFKNKILKIKSTTTQKQEILLKKNRIIELINERAGEKIVNEIE